jgi:curved DNA-binding protein CbpA/ribosomal protein S27E
MPTSPELDYYRVLNVHHQADPEIIKEAYDSMRRKFQGAPAAERDIDAAYAVLGDPEKRTAYDARRAAALRAMSAPKAMASKPAQSVAPAPARAMAPKPTSYMADANSDRHTVPAKCSLTGDGFDIVLLRAKGPLARFRVVGFEPWLPDESIETEPRQNLIGRLFKLESSRRESGSQPPPDEANDDLEYFEFSKFEFGAHRCPICDGEAPPTYGHAKRWVMCGRCDHILCMGAADDDPNSLAVTCPWCGTTLRFGGPTKSGGRVRASSKPRQLDSNPNTTPLLPGSKKQLPKG